MLALQDLGLDMDNAATERFLVTGSEGCLGAWTVRTLATAGAGVVVAADLAPAGSRLDKLMAGPRSNVIHEQVDLRDTGQVVRLVGEHGITRIVHLAALQVPFVVADPVLGAQVNVVGTVNVLEAAAGSDTVRGLSYASSAAALGPARAPYSPETLYGVYKACNEHTARLYAEQRGLGSVGLRPCIVYGPTRDQGMTAALTTALKAVVLGNCYEIPFGGFVDVQFAEDVAVAFVRAAMTRAPDAPVYDLHGDGVTVAEYLATLVQVAPEAAELISIGPGVIPGAVEVDDAPLVERVGPLPKTSLRDGIARSLEILRGHRESGVLTAGEVAVA